MKIRCEICKINKAQLKDYRMPEDSESYNKYLVCLNCFMLDDKWFFKLKYAKEERDKKKIISKIVNGALEDYYTEGIKYEENQE
ncbi:MAG TPA: hypothetical protein ENI53_02445 [Thermoplasmatales archaeon]|nr:hypothetical protein [Thermoplasmatales archaeon]